MAQRDLLVAAAECASDVLQRRRSNYDKHLNAGESTESRNDYLRVICWENLHHDKPKLVDKKLTSGLQRTIPAEYNNASRVDSTRWSRRRHDYCCDAVCGRVLRVAQEWTTDMRVTT